jgi:hypothetical protein
MDLLDTLEEESEVMQTLNGTKKLRANICNDDEINSERTKGFLPCKKQQDEWPLPITPIEKQLATTSQVKHILPSSISVTSRPEKNCPRPIIKNQAPRNYCKPPGLNAVDRPHKSICMDTTTTGINETKSRDLWYNS